MNDLIPNFAQEVIVCFDFTRNRSEFSQLSNILFKDFSIKFSFRENYTHVVKFAPDFRFGYILYKDGKSIINQTWGGYESTDQQILLTTKVPTVELEQEYELELWCKNDNKLYGVRDKFFVKDWQCNQPDTFIAPSLNMVTYHEDYTPTPEQIETDMQFLSADFLNNINK